jgi:hypothetical protein
LTLALAVVVPAGLASKLLGGPWLRDFGVGVLYEVFWILAVLLVRPWLSAAVVAVVVLVATSLLEVLQLWHPAWLEAVRNTFVGHALLGSHFSWWDFPHYVAGCIVGALLGRVLARGGARTHASG